MGLFSKPKEVAPPKPAHYVDVVMVKGSGWNFNHDTEDKARATLARVVEAMNNGDKVITINDVVINVSYIKYANYRDHHRTYYF